MYELLLTIHVVAAVLWVGGGITVHVLARHVSRSGDPQRMLDFARESYWIGPRFYAPLSVVLLVAGVLLVDEAGFELSQLWITLAFVGWGISFLVGVLYYGREQKRMEEAVASEGPAGPTVAESVRRVMLVNAAEVTILLLLVVDMTVKPGV